MKYVLQVVTLFLFIMVPIAADNSSLQVNADISSVPVYFDNQFKGVTPITIFNISSGYHLVKASPEGFFEQTQNVSVNSTGEIELSFIFLSSDRQMPAMVRIGECIGTPQPSELYGSAYDLLRIADGTLMAYFSGHEDGIRCMASSDGIFWDNIPGPCLEVTSKGSDFRAEPWVFFGPDAKYRMIYSQAEGNEQHLYSASSTDGIRFIGEKEITIITDDELSPPVIPSVPSGVLYPDGTVRIYYHVPGAGIKSAISEDLGISWKSEDGIRIQNGTDPTTMLLPDGRTGVVYVDTTPKSKGQRIFFLLSEDGLNFSKYKPIQLLESTEPDVWLMDPEVVVDDDSVYLYFSVMGIEGMQNHGLPGTLRSIISTDCLENSAVVEN